MPSKKVIWSAIIGASLTAGLTTAAGFFPHISPVLAAGAALVTAVVTYVGST